jgi:hypothetical protein
MTPPPDPADKDAFLWPGGAEALRDLFGLEISQGALVNILRAGRSAFCEQTDRIKASLREGQVVASDETGLRVGKANWWLWVFHHATSAIFVADKHRSKAVVEGLARGTGAPTTGYRTATAARWVGPRESTRSVSPI